MSDVIPPSQENTPEEEKFPREQSASEETEMPEFDFTNVKPEATGSRRDNLGFTPLPTPERRRRQRRPLIVRPTLDEIAERLENIALRAIPTFDFFLFSFVLSIMLGFGYLIDSPAVLFFGILTSPLLAPWVGATLGIATGDSRYLRQTLGGFSVSLLIVFIFGILLGLASRLFAMVFPPAYNQLYLQASLQLPDLLLLIFGAIVFVLSFIQTDEKPLLPGLMLSYALYMPISASGFGLGAGLPAVFQGAMLAFLVRLAVSFLLALVVFYYMGFRPVAVVGYAWGIGTIAISLLAVIGFMGFGSILNTNTLSPLSPAATPTVLLTTRSAPPAVATTVTPTQEVVSTNTEVVAAATATVTVVKTRTVVTPTDTATPELPTPMSTPVYGRIASKVSNGATIRESPTGNAITTILNDYLVEILPDEPQFVSGNYWIHVRVNFPNRVIDGWVLQSVVATPNPPTPTQQP